MTRRCSIVLACVVLLAGGLAGCQKPNMEEMMKPPVRPAELDQLNMFLGTWQGTWEFNVAGTDKPMKGSGTDTFSWAADKWAMVGHSEGTMDGHKMVGTGTLMWDSKARRFRYTGTDSYGMIMTGTARFDPETKTWHMKGKTRDTMKGHQSVGEGTARMVDPNTMEWHWTEWDSLHLMKFMEMNGTSKKIK